MKVLIDFELWDSTGTNLLGENKVAPSEFQDPDREEGEDFNGIQFHEPGQPMDDIDAEDGDKIKVKVTFVYSGGSPQQVDCSDLEDIDGEV